MFDPGKIKGLSRELLSIGGIIEIAFISSKGDLIFKEPSNAETNHAMELWKLVSNIKGIKEVDLSYDKMRIFIKRIKDDWLIVSANHSAQLAFIRLNINSFQDV